MAQALGQFCLVSPNWTVQLPGGHYDGRDSDIGLEDPEKVTVAFLVAVGGAESAARR